MNSLKKEQMFFLLLFDWQLIFIKNFFDLYKKISFQVQFC